MFLKRVKIFSNVKIVLKNRRIIKGIFLSHDSFMNILLSDCEEFKEKTAFKTWEFRNLGLCFIRGDSIVSISIEK
nr:small nuclear ribonucleoprotein-associated protein B [Cryptomonas sp.]